MRAQRIVTAVVVAFSLLVVMTIAGESPPAQAATRNGSFTVAATVNNGCTFFAWNMNFAGYTSGQSSVVGGNSLFRVFCSSATAGSPIPVTFTVTAPGGFRMANGASGLNYRLCLDLGCSLVVPNGVPAGAVFIDKVAYDAPYFGQIFANQVVAPGPYAQTVNVTLTY